MIRYLALAMLLVGCAGPLQTQSPTMPYAESPIQTPIPPTQNAPTATTVAHEGNPAGIPSSIERYIAESNRLENLKADPAIIEITARHRAALAALCWVEVRGFDDVVNYDACLSIVSTVLARATYHLMSDGTVEGTLTWGCTKDSEWCQFPAYVWNGCQGIVPALCPYNSPSTLELFRRAVDAFFYQGRRGSCDGYLMYGVKSFDPPECRISDDYNGFLNFHRRPTR